MHGSTSPCKETSQSVSRKSFVIAVVLVTFIVGSVGTTLYVLLRHEPDFYAEAEVPPGSQRQLESKEFEEKAVDLLNEINNGTEWRSLFTQEQVNSYLAEDFLRSKPIQLDSEIRDPRVVFQPGKVLLAFRYGSAQDWSSVVSIRAKVWIVKREPNVVAVEIEDIRAGAMPLAPKMIQDRLAESLRQQNIDIVWYRNEGNPVALVRFQYDKREPNIQLEELELRDGSIYLKGRSIDPDMRREIVEATESGVR
jgi:hypothetical protein